MMTGGLCVCVLLVVLCRSCLGSPYSSQPLGEGQHSSSTPFEAHLEADTHALGARQFQQSHPIPHLKGLPVAEGDEDTRANLSELLARLISSRKASVRRNSTANSRGSANHRIADRDYMGWIDFGRRSAEEYEYAS